MNELFKQCIKLALGATALVVLVLINSNIHQMVLCLMRAPIDKVMVSPPPLMPNCTSHTFRHGLDLRVDVCRGEETGMVAFYLENAILRSYSLEDSTRLVDWLRRCTAPPSFPQLPVPFTPLLILTAPITPLLMKMTFFVTTINPCTL